MSKTGINRIDDLLAGTPGSMPIGPGETDRLAVGAIQDLLVGLGNSRMPDCRLPAHGNYGSMTVAAIQQFRTAKGLPPGDSVDAACLAALAQTPHTTPVATRCYIALGLDLVITPMTYLMTLTGLWEANARFAALNLNTDKKGLSFGLIQWAQKPGRLNEIVTAFRNADPGRFHSTFGGQTAAEGLIQHTAKKSGGVDPVSGLTTDPAFDLISEPWVSRFRAAGLDPVFQRAQVATATTDAQSAYATLQSQTPLITTQRGVAFLLDVANQHGAGGAASIYQTVAPSSTAEPDLLKRMRDESVRRVTAQYGQGSPEAASTASRRDWFLTTPVLSDVPFVGQSAAGA
jgi:hypothetical protein